MIRSTLGDVKVYHFRNFNFEGKVDNKGGATFCFVNVAGVWKYASSHCSERDNFSRKIGRAIAIGRLEAGKGIKEFGLDAPTYEDIQRIDEMESLELSYRSGFRTSDIPEELRS